MKVNRRFGGTCRFHLQGERISQARNKREPDSKQSLLFGFERTTWRYITEDRILLDKMLHYNFSR
jgi:hypothetical protein